MAPPDTTPRRRQFSESLIDISLGRFPGLQMNRAPGAAATNEITVHNARGEVVVVSSGAPIGGPETDVLTWVVGRWAREGANGDDPVVRTTLYQLTRAMYGHRRIGGDDYRAIAEALANLVRAVITIQLVDPEIVGDAAPALFSDRHLVEQVDYGEEIMRRRLGFEVDVATLGGLRDETLNIHLPKWMVERLEIDAFRGWLDWPKQRQMGSGMGKRLWLFVDLERGYEPTPSDEDLEMLTVELTEKVYETLGAKCAVRQDNRKVIRRGLAKILATDDRYISLDDNPEHGCELIPGRNGREDVLRVVRRRR